MSDKRTIIPRYDKTTSLNPKEEINGCLQADDRLGTAIPVT
jgi:hypothetical protein